MFAFFNMNRQICMTREAKAAYGPVQLPHDLAPVGVMTGGAFSLFNRSVVVFVPLRGASNRGMTPVAVFLLSFDQLKIIVTGVFVVALQALSFFKSGMDDSAFDLI